MSFNLPLLELYSGWVLLVLTFILFLVSLLVYFKERNLKGLDLFIFLILLFQGIVILLRWISVGHGPYLTRYEVFLSNGWIILALYFIFRFLLPGERIILRVGALTGNLIFLLLAVNGYTHEVGVPPKYFYIWLVIHVLFSKLALGSLLIALGYAIALLRKGSNPNWEKNIYKLLIITLFFWAIVIVSGAIWANERWGRYWGWDPIETWSLIVWLVLAVIVHLIRFYKLGGRALGLLVVLSIFLMIVITAFLPFIVNTIHTLYLLGGAS